MQGRVGWRKPPFLPHCVQGASRASSLGSALTDLETETDRTSRLLTQSIETTQRHDPVIRAWAEQVACRTPGRLTQSASAKRRQESGLLCAAG